ncbi:Uncharacterised protein [Bacillus freudenreichii]|nr:Uncharacterised protein [Bacillus freudenreichii]
MQKAAKYIGVISGLASITLWAVLNFFNPYSNIKGTDTITISFLMLFLPACLAVISSLTSKQSLMMIAFVWSLPFSLYVVFTPGAFALFGVTCIAYLGCFLLMKLSTNRKI